VNARNVGGTSAYSVVWNFTTSLVGVDVPSGLPTEFAIAQNYPNPFNPTTTIQYDLPEDGRLLVTVYNMLGQQVKTLYNGNQLAGSYTTVWDATNDRGDRIASGIYFYRIQSGRFVQTRKMLLLR
jgi:hypothetical protein